MKYEIGQKVKGRFSGLFVITDIVIMQGLLFYVTDEIDKEKGGVKRNSVVPGQLYFPENALLPLDDMEAISTICN